MLRHHGNKSPAEHLIRKAQAGDFDLRETGENLD
jgi:hypothetical protein